MPTVPTRPAIFRRAATPPADPEPLSVGDHRYVVRNESRGGWDVRGGDTREASAHFPTQAEAIAGAHRLVEREGGARAEVRVQDPDGRFRTSDPGH